MSSTNSGGLGVGSLFAFNISLLMKWVWRFRNNEDNFWVKIIRAIYGRNGLIGTDGSRGSGSVWCGILKAVHTLRGKGIDLVAKCSRKIGNGKDTLFWYDKWFGDVVFKDRFPRLFHLDCDKLCSVEDRASRKSLDNWTSVLLRVPNRGAGRQQLDEICELMSRMVLSDTIDKWHWELNGDGSYSVSLVRNHVDGAILDDGSPKTRWNSLLPIKINIFIWRLRLNRLPTYDNLELRGIDIPSSLCVVCGNGTESSDHLFFGCPMAKELHVLFARWWKVPVVDLNSFDNWVDWLKNLRLSKYKHACLEASNCVLLWFIWRFRNDSIFGVKKPKPCLIFDNMVTQSFFWFNYRSRNFQVNWVGWLADPANAIMM